MADEAKGAVAAAGGAAAEGAAAPPRRKGRPTEVPEVTDELAVEAKRTTLLDRVESQLKGKSRYSRLLFGFAAADDRKVQGQIEEEFGAWRQAQDGQAADLTGLLVFTTQGAVHLLEGPTELLFAALRFFGGALAAEGAGADGAARPALVGALRVLHFAEVRGVRVSAGWAATVHGGKLAGGQQVIVEETNCPEFIFALYNKLVLMCAKVREVLEMEQELLRPPPQPMSRAVSKSSKTAEEFASQDTAEETSADSPQAFDPASVQEAYRKASDMLPTVDDVAILLGKSTADLVFSYEEFEKVFIAPFHLVLHSELLWPMAPPLSY